MSKDCQAGGINGIVIVSMDSVPVGQIMFRVTVTTITQVQTPSQLLPVGEMARHYFKAFVSYASEDRAEVVKRVQMLPLQGITFFQDLLDLSPGDRWEKELYRRIDESDLFLLFWSTAAKQSEWVLRELRYAISRKGGKDENPPTIHPVMIEGPPPPTPPQELQHLHFNDYLLYFIREPGSDRKPPIPMPPPIAST